MRAFLIVGAECPRVAQVYPMVYPKHLILHRDAQPCMGTKKQALTRLGVRAY